MPVPVRGACECTNEGFTLRTGNILRSVPLLNKNKDTVETPSQELAAAIFRSLSDPDLLANPGERDEREVTVKLFLGPHGSPHDVEQSLSEVLVELGTSFADYLLVSVPKDVTSDAFQPIWRAMEAAFQSGKARRIGVTDFTKEQLQVIASYATVFPHVNQVVVECCRKHLQQMLDFAQETGMELLSHPQAEQELLMTPHTLQAIAEKVLVEQQCDERPHTLPAKWIARYIVVIPSRSLATERGYLIHWAKE